MTTALDLVTRAMRLCRVIGVGETPSDEEAADGFEALNAMLASWQTRRLFAYRIEENSYTWTGGNQSRTVGPAGNFVQSRPAKVDDSTYWLLNGISYPVKLIDSDAWAAIPAKTSQSTFAFWMYPEYGVSLVTLYAYPIPSADITLKLRSWSLLQSFTALTDVLSLPMGYERAIAYSLAEDFAPEFGVSVPDDVRRIASEAKHDLRVINSVPPVMVSEVGYLNRRVQGNVYADIPN